MPGPMELVIILVIVAMLFGVGRLPEIFGAVGKGIREFRNETSPADSPKMKGEKGAVEVVETPPAQTSATTDLPEAMLTGDRHDAG